ncbi:MAG: hypothetical protein ABR529_11710 [Actinomycetota bacterium]
MNFEEALKKAKAGAEKGSVVWKPEVAGESIDGKITWTGEVTGEFGPTLKVLIDGSDGTEWVVFAGSDILREKLENAHPGDATAILFKGEETGKSGRVYKNFSVRVVRPDDGAGDPNPHVAVADVPTQGDDDEDDSQSFGGGVAL